MNASATEKTATIGEATVRFTTAALPSHARWRAGARKHGPWGACVCCGRKVGDDALQVLVPSGGTMDGRDYGKGFDRFLDPAEPGDDFCSYSIGSDCAKALPTGFALSADDLADALQVYARRPDVLERHGRLFPRLHAAA